MILALALPAFTGTVPQPNAELDAAHACLRTGIAAQLADNPPPPLDGERWEWALTIADKCEGELNAAADSKEAIALFAEVSHGTITKRQALRSEALYFVDRLIRQHYEAQQ
jgi:hypothetical protein